MVWVFSLAGSPGTRLRPFSAHAARQRGRLRGPGSQGQQPPAEDYRFNPARSTVATGTKVTFRNAGTQPHNASSSDGGGWDTGLLAGGESATVTFNRPGTYTFACTPHPSMIGQIVVTGPELASAAATVVEPLAVEPPAGKSTETKPSMPADHGAH